MSQWVMGTSSDVFSTGLWMGGRWIERAGATVVFSTLHANYILSGIP